MITNTMIHRGTKLTSNRVRSLANQHPMIYGTGQRDEKRQQEGNRLTRSNVLIAHQYQAKYSPGSRQRPGPQTHNKGMGLHGVKETSMVCQNAVSAYRNIQDPIVGCRSPLLARCPQLNCGGACSKDEGCTLYHKNLRHETIEATEALQRLRPDVSSRDVHAGR